MKILLDHNIPHALRSHFHEEHEVHTAQYKGWEDFSDEEIFTAAEEEGYALFVTLDTNLPHQRNLDDWAIGVIVLDVHPATPDRLVGRMEKINKLLFKVAERETLFEID